MQYIISGKVIKGEGYGRKLGFPTVNLETIDTLPPAGVYAGNAAMNDKSYRAGILINPSGKVEAYLLGYNGNAYGSTVVLETKEFLRNYEKFNTEEELIKQIEKDLKKCSQV